MQEKQSTTNQGSSLWIGLDSYKESNSDIFFGRDEEIRQLSGDIFNNIQTIIYGPSGTGKTSIIQAGIFKIARANRYLPVYVRLNHNTGSKTYTQQIIDVIQEEAEKYNIDVEKTSPYIEQNVCLSLWEYFHCNDFWNDENYPVVPLIVVDQFEEIFTLGKNLPWQPDFFIQLSDLCDNKCPQYVIDYLNDRKNERIEYPEKINYRFVISLREDFLPRLEEQAETIPALKRNRFSLQCINEEQALDIILKPQPGLVSEDVAALIIEKVTNKKYNEDFRFHNTPEILVEPAILSLFCRELDKKRHEKNMSTLSSDLIGEFGDNIIRDFYLNSLSSLSEGNEEKKSPLPTRDEKIDYLESRLITVDGFRDAVAYQNAKAFGFTKNDIKTLIDNRLVRIDEWDGTRRIEFIHDVLCKVANKHRKERDQERENKKKEEEAKRLLAEEKVKREKERQIQEEKLRKAEEEKQILLRKQQLQKEENRLLQRKQEEELARAEREKQLQQEQLARAEEERKLLLRQQELQEEEKQILLRKQEEEHIRQEREKKVLEEKNRKYRKKVKRNRIFFLLVTLISVFASPWLFNYFFPPAQWKLVLLEDQTVGSENYWKVEVFILSESSDTLYPVQILDKSHSQTIYPTPRINNIRVIVQFLAGNFSTVDTIMPVKDSLTIPISRAYGRIKYEGKVIDGRSGQPIKNAVVMVGNQITKANHKGFFSAYVEQTDISNDGTIKIFKSGYNLLNTKIKNGVPYYKLQVENSKAFLEKLAVIQRKIAGNAFEMTGEIAGSVCHLKVCMKKDSIWGLYYYDKTKEEIRSKSKEKKDTIFAEIIFSGKLNADKTFHLDGCDWVYNLEEFNGRINDDNSWEGYWNAYLPDLYKFKFVKKDLNNER